MVGIILEETFLVLPGKPYDWGKAQGQLLGEKAVKMMDAVWEYLEDQVVEYRGYLSLISIAAFDISFFTFPICLRLIINGIYIIINQAQSNMHLSMISKYFRSRL